MFQAQFPTYFQIKFGVIFGLEVLITCKRNLLSFQSGFLKDFGAILAPEMAPGRVPKRGLLCFRAPQALQNNRHGFRIKKNVPKELLRPEKYIKHVSNFRFCYRIF